MTKPLTFVIACLFTMTTTAANTAAFKPLMLHPENPHYFLFRGRPTVLITSGEHYGAVLNQDFDYRTYLDTLKAEGMNLTRAVPGTSLEGTNAGTYRGGDQNTFAPRPGRFLAPWARSDTPGYFYGGNKFDLDRWDEKFFQRLKDFVGLASERGIVVEFNLFYVLYGDGPEFGKWNLHPLNARNNVNNVGHVPFHRYNTLDEPALVARQEAVLRKLLTELNAFDNVYYEICDEPYCSGASPKETEAWQNHLLEVADTTMRNLPYRQLLAVNYANDYIVVKETHPAVSVLNFHYSFPPAVVPLNWSLNKPVCFDESSGGHMALERRREAWAFLLSGGAVYNNLDPSFATDDPTGSGKMQQPDGRFDGRALRKQLRILREFMESLDFIHMQPDHSAVAPGAKAERTSRFPTRCSLFVRRRPSCSTTSFVDRCSPPTIGPRFRELPQIISFHLRDLKFALGDESGDVPCQMTALEGAVIDLGKKAYSSPQFVTSETNRIHSEERLPLTAAPPVRPQSELHFSARVFPTRPQFAGREQAT